MKVFRNTTRPSGSNVLAPDHHAKQDRPAPSEASTEAADSSFEKSVVLPYFYGAALHGRKVCSLTCGTLLMRYPEPSADTAPRVERLRLDRPAHTLDDLKEPHNVLLGSLGAVLQHPWLLRLQQHVQPQEYVSSVHHVELLYCRRIDEQLQVAGDLGF